MELDKYQNTRKKRKPPKARGSWSRSPVEQRIESKKRYNRKKVNKRDISQIQSEGE